MIYISIWWDSHSGRVFCTRTEEGLSCKVQGFDCRMSTWMPEAPSFSSCWRNNIFTWGGFESRRQRLTLRLALVIFASQQHLASWRRRDTKYMYMQLSTSFTPPTLTPSAPPQDNIISPNSSPGISNPPPPHHKYDNPQHPPLLPHCQSVPSASPPNLPPPLPASPHLPRLPRVIERHPRDMARLRTAATVLSAHRR